MALVGLPDDLGVRLNGGRPGAALGPTAFRAALARYGTGFDASDDAELGVGVFDAGDVTPSGVGGATPSTQAMEASLQETHRRVTEAVLAVHEMGLVPVCIGGGHDLTFPAVRALAQHSGAPVAGINVDAHLDVRATPGSGMAFRSLIDGGFVDPRRLIEIGVGRFANAREHVEWLAAQGAKKTIIDRVLAEPGAAIDRAFGVAAGTPTVPTMSNPKPRALGPFFVSIDLDSIDGSQAPGVSAVNPMGLEVRHAVRVARQAGGHAGVRHFDLMELNPVHDDPAWDEGARVPGRTARVAALLFLSFIAGFAERPSERPAAAEVKK